MSIYLRVMPCNRPCSTELLELKQLIKNRKIYKVTDILLKNSIFLNNGYHELNFKTICCLGLHFCIEKQVERQYLSKIKYFQ